MRKNLTSEKRSFEKFIFEKPAFENISFKKKLPIEKLVFETVMVLHAGIRMLVAANACPSAAAILVKYRHYVGDASGSAVAAAVFDWDGFLPRSFTPPLNTCRSVA
jgi:hypothetical protein